MSPSEIEQTLHDLFSQHFHIPPEVFSWETPLEALNQDFKLLSYLIYLEQLVHKRIGNNIQIVENISPAFHTPKDVLVLIINEL